MTVIFADFPHGIRTMLVAGVAELIADAGLGVWNTAGVYPAGVWGIYDSVIPPAVDKLITLTPYEVFNDPSLSDSVLGLQVRTRAGVADPRHARDQLEFIFNVLHGATHLDLGGLTVLQMVCQSSAELGQDENHRWSYADSYYCTVHRPTDNRQ